MSAFDVSALIPAFPEDIERTINYVLLNHDRKMCGTMSLVASRFYTWTKPITFRVVVIHQRNDWTKRISDLLIPNAGYIRVLAITLRFPRDQLTDEELSLIRRLLEAAVWVKHLAVDWNIWAHFDFECGSLHLESLYLIWDRVHPRSPPSLHHLQHPAALKDLAIYAPPDLDNPMPFRQWGQYFLPDVAHCVNLAYVTYAASRVVSRVASLCTSLPYIKGVMFVMLPAIPRCQQEPPSGSPPPAPLQVKDLILSRATAALELYPNFSTAHVLNPSDLLGEWLAKMEGRSSVLEHSTPGAGERDPTAASYVAIRELGVAFNKGLRMLVRLPLDLLDDNRGNA